MFKAVLGFLIISSSTRFSVNSHLEHSINSKIGEGSPIGVISIDLFLSVFTCLVLLTSGNRDFILFLLIFLGDLK